MTNYRKSLEFLPEEIGYRRVEIIGCLISHQINDVFGSDNEFDFTEEGLQTIYSYIFKAYYELMYVSIGYLIHTFWKILIIKEIDLDDISYEHFKRTAINKLIEDIEYDKRQK